MHASGTRVPFQMIGSKVDILAPWMTAFNGASFSVVSFPSRSQYSLNAVHPPLSESEDGTYMNVLFHRYHRIDFMTHQ